MIEEQFDAMLAQALRGAILKDLKIASTFEAYDNIEYSRRHQRRMRKMCSNPFGYAKKQVRPTWKNVLRAAACVVLIISVSFGSICAISPEARAWVSKVVIEWFETYTGFSFHSEDSGQGCGQWTPSWLPEGFYVSQENYIPTGFSKITIESPDGEMIQLYYCQIKEFSLNVDNESSNYQVVSEGAYTLHLFRGKTSADESVVVCVFEEKDIIFKLSSAIDINYLIDIAKGMKEK